MLHHAGRSGELRPCLQSAPGETDKCYKSGIRKEASPGIAPSDRDSSEDPQGQLFTLLMSYALHQMKAAYLRQDLCLFGG